MTLTQLRAFLAAFELGSFTAAATRLGVSQASMSELIGRLEQEVGLTLFTRGGRRLIPTAAAMELREHAEQTVTSFDNGLQALRSLASLEGGVCTFGVLRNAGYYDLSDLVQRFHKRYPKVKVRLVGLNSALVAESVARGEVEAGLVVLPVVEEGLQIRPLFRDEVYYVSAHRSPRRGPMTIEEFAESKLVLYDAYAGWRDPTRRQLQERAQLKGLRIDPVIEVEHVETALNLVATGAADTIVSHSVVNSRAFPKNLKTVPFAEPLYDTLALVQRESSYLSPAARKLAELAARTLSEKAAAAGLGHGPTPASASV
ncbi:LysR family transcriptional regulator [Sinomonas cellulolyticus]|uniref:LysR family transcriptional regulator n=1 Tax=Sinomonas cellulolyticus TaxID=2801916 RepID=A0ABS1K4Q2_9MICC|nr:MULTISPECIES: LysR family transcriptional regulator [Sinomonas]MBL0706267.1 LysR family transcriptional regulator [Sinomonas cellulolyticus]GHG61149.1 LysR family transcriptional regulator [Sinomonas sp. KCTC 49339]